MRETRITLPELILVAGTRVALGAGLGMLLADRLTLDQRRAVGWTLFLVAHSVPFRWRLKSSPGTAFLARRNDLSRPRAGCGARARSLFRVSLPKLDARGRNAIFRA